MSNNVWKVGFKMSEINNKNIDEDQSLEQRLGLIGDVSEEDFNEKIDKYLISLFNKKDELGKKEFSKKVIEIFQTTDWDGGKMEL